MNRSVLQKLFYALILTLIFEGVTRKMMPVSIGKFMILFKDFLLVLIACGTITASFKGELKNIRLTYFVFIGLLSPLILYTFLKDPFLAAFGIKQYLLYPFTLFGFVLAFQNYGKRDFILPLRMMTILLLPLTMLAVVQIFLPDTHWLNLSVTGEDLSAFKAGGRLRVSSTFPFVAQFCYYLTVLLPVLWITVTLKKKTTETSFFTKLEAIWILIPFFIVANVITGSRLAVVTNLMVIVLAAGLLLIRGKTKNIGRLIGFIITIVISIFVARYALPEAFEAYEARTGDSALVDEEEMSERLEHIVMGWWHIYQRHDPGTFGFGIGVMSNGVQNFSNYAAQIRSRAWGETDLANVVLEGGLYLVFIWLGFRALIIYYCFRLYQRITSPKLIYMASFAMGFVIFNGLTQTLGTQPPLAIWWWLAIGLIVHTYRFELYLKRKKKLKAAQANSSKKSLAAAS